MTPERVLELGRIEQKAGRWPLSLGSEVSIALAKAIAAESLKEIREARREAVEECCRAVCYWCKEGVEVLEMKNLVMNGTLWKHKRTDNAYTNCYAEAIRRLEGESRCGATYHNQKDEYHVAVCEICKRQ